jgi:hypothetical protein
LTLCCGGKERRTIQLDAQTDLGELAGGQELEEKLGDEIELVKVHGEEGEQGKDRYDGPEPPDVLEALVCARDLVSDATISGISMAQPSMTL